MDLITKLQIANYISGVILALVGIVGLLQLWFYKSEVKARFNRLSVDNSIKIQERYYNMVIMYDEFCERIKKENIPKYKGTIEKPIVGQVFDDNTIKRMENNFHLILNEIELISASILCGTCNGKFIYNCIGKSFLNTVASNFDLLMATRLGNEVNKYYNNTYELFTIWRDKYLEKELNYTKESLEKQIKSLRVTEIKEIK